MRTDAILIIAVRKNLTEAVTEKFGLAGAGVIDVASGDVVRYANEIAAMTPKKPANE